MKMPQQTAASLCSLPRELIDNTLSFVKNPANISSLSMASKRMRKLTIDALFGEITMTWKCERTQSGDSDYHQTQTPRLDLLLRTLIEAPSLAGKVTKINFQLRGFKSSRSSQLPPRVQLPRMTYATSYGCSVRGALTRVYPDNQHVTDDIIRGVLDNQFEAVVAAMLLVCSRLMVLVVDSNIFRRNNYLTPVLRHVLPDSDIVLFEHLRVFKLGLWLLESEDDIAWSNRPSRYYPRDAVELSTYLPLFYIKGLQEATICLPRLEKQATLKWPLPVAPRLFSLHTLQLPECSLLPEALHKILSATPCLQRLDYACWMFEDQIFNADTFSMALGEVRDTLQHLRVNLMHWNDDQFDPKGFYYSAEWVEGSCSLKHLSQLETLYISSCVLLGWDSAKSPALIDILPPNIVSLELTDDEFSWYQEFLWTQDEVLVAFNTLFAREDWRKVLPNIQKISIDYEEWDEELALSQMCGQNGLDLVFNHSY